MFQSETITYSKINKRLHVSEMNIQFFFFAILYPFSSVL